MVYESKYGGELIRVPLSSLIRRGRGDDVFVVVDKENHSKYGILSVDTNQGDYELAQKFAADSLGGEPIMIAVEDPNNGSPMMLTRQVDRGKNRHFLAVIFNADFADDPEECSAGSYCLRLSNEFDPNSKVSERIVYSPGKCIEWCSNQLEKIMSLLDE